MSETQIEISQVNGIQVIKAGGEGPNILFLHDAGQPVAGMIRHIRQLAEAGQVVAPNYFDATGKTIREGKKPSYEDLVYELDRMSLMDKSKPTGIVGVSMGAALGWEYAAQNLQEVAWIVAGSPLGWPLHRSLFGWLKEFAILTHKINQIPAEQKKLDPGITELFKQFKKDPRGVLGGLKLATTTDSRAQMASISAPVDLLWGKNDNYTPYWMGENMRNIMLNARLAVVSEYPHYWYQFEPQKLTIPAIQRIRDSGKA